jgi:hypothetical protein
MNTDIHYAFRVDASQETPCHLSEIKKGDVFYFVKGGQKSALMTATEDAFSSEVNGQLLWSIPHDIYE